MRRRLDIVAWLIVALWLTIAFVRASGMTNQDLLNKFADDYNVYITKLRAGVVDTRLWGKVKKDWEEINR